MAFLTTCYLGMIVNPLCSLIISKTGILLLFKRAKCNLCPKGASSKKLEVFLLKNLMSCLFLGFLVKDLIRSLKWRIYSRVLKVMSFNFLLELWDVFAWELIEFQVNYDIQWAFLFWVGLLSSFQGNFRRYVSVFY